MANYRKSRIAAHVLLFVTILGLTIAYAGEYHAIKEKTFSKGGPTGETLACSQCHTMHGSQGRYSMIYGSSALLAGTVYQKLLRQSSILNLCLYCHDNNQAGFPCTANTPCPPDVWIGTGAGAVLSAGQKVNSAGLLCSGGSTGTVPCSGGTSSGTTNHTVDPNASVTPPGWTGASPLFTAANEGFTCVNCHNPHGTTSFRNLRDNGAVYRGVTFMSAGETVSYSMGAADATKYVNNLVAAGFGLAKYATTAVTFRFMPAVPVREQGMQGFCRSCHTLFHDASGSVAMGGSAAGDNTSAAGDTWVRHPVMDVTMGEGQANLHVAAAAYWSGLGTTTTGPRIINPDGSATGNTDDQPFCLSCHRAHGSGRHSNLIYGNPNTTVDGAGTGMRDTCNQCHNQ